MTTAVVVGSSVAGVKTAQALVSQHYPGRVMVIGEEGRPPYDKPPLSKQLLMGKVEESACALMRTDDPGTAAIELRLGRRAEHLDPARRRLRLSGGEVLHYDHLVVATGSRARPSPWGDGGGRVVVLRTMADALTLRRQLREAASVAVVGAGFIGAEVASSARTLGLDVALIDPLPLPLGRVVGDRAGELLARLHEAHGSAVHFGTGVAALDADSHGVTVELTDGGSLRTSLAVVGIGAEPNDAWLAASGLPVADGVVCDEHCRVMGVGEVFAAGDVARWHHPRHGRQVRIEHWTNAVEQASCVAHNIMHPDQPRPYQPVEYVWTDQYDWKIQIAGRPHDGAWEVMVSRDGERSRFAVAYAGLREQLVGAMTVNWPRGLVECRRMLATDTPLAGAVDRLRELFG
jgi:phthalate 3,4-dioxygenase ferredoxin reductase subunit